jgi:hypothetical protein
MNEQMKFLLNLVVFQGAWFACVLGSKSSYPMLYPVLGFCAVLGLVIFSKRFGAAFPFLLSSVALGMVGDSLLVRLELLAFYANPTVGGAPLWMIILWANFGLMLRPLFPGFWKIISAACSDFPLVEWLLTMRVGGWMPSPLHPVGKLPWPY